MQVRVDLTRIDLLRLNFYSLLYLPANRISLGLVWIAVFLIGLLWPGRPLNGTAVFVQLIVATLMVVVTLVLAFAIHTLVVLTTRWRDAGVLGEHLISITPEGLSDRTPVSESLTRWAGIRDIVRTGYWIRVSLRQRAFHVIPCRAFATPADCDAFHEQLVASWKGATRSSEINTPPDALSATEIDSSAAIAGAAPSSRVRSAAASPFVNLTHGVRLAAGLPVRAAAFRASFEGILLLLAIALVVLGVVTYRTAVGERYFDGSGAAMAGSLLAVFLLYVLAVARVHGAAVATLLATMLASASPWYLAVACATVGRYDHAEPLVAIWGFLIVVRSLRLALPGRASAAIAATLLLACGAWFLPWARMPAPALFFGYTEAPGDAGYDVDAEDVYYRQPALVDALTAQLLPQRPGVPDLYFVAFAGDGDSPVFQREAEYARSVMDRDYGTAGRSLVLSNDRDHLDDAPLANRHNLALLLRGVAARMDPEEDALFLFLTSHGSEDAELAVALAPLDLDDLLDDDVRAALDDAGIRWRIVVISACHSGSFIDALRDERTLILTAAAADRQSFGCADDRTLTYFGEALFEDALTHDSDLLTAFGEARSLIAQREAAEGLKPSLPQIEIGAQIGPRLEALEGRHRGIW